MSRRVVSVWFQRLPSERVLRARPVAGPFALSQRQSNTERVYCLNAAASAQGLQKGMGLGEARVLCPNLQTAEAAPEADARFMQVLARWATQYCPWVAIEPDGLALDITGAAHLRGGEVPLLEDISSRLTRAGLSHRLGLADTYGAAWALARFGQSRASAGPKPTAQTQATSGTPLLQARHAPPRTSLAGRTAKAQGFSGPTGDKAGFPGMVAEPLRRFARLNGAAGQRPTRAPALPPQGQSHAVKPPPCAALSTRNSANKAGFCAAHCRQRGVYPSPHAALPRHRIGVPNACEAEEGTRSTQAQTIGRHGHAVMRISRDRHNHHLGGAETLRTAQARKRQSPTHALWLPLHVQSSARMPLSQAPPPAWPDCHQAKLATNNPNAPLKPQAPHRGIPTSPRLRPTPFPVLKHRTPPRLRRGSGATPLAPVSPSYPRRPSPFAPVTTLAGACWPLWRWPQAQCSQRGASVASPQTQRSRAAAEAKPRRGSGALAPEMAGAAGHTKNMQLRSIWAPIFCGHTSAHQRYNLLGAAPSKARLVEPSRTITPARSPLAQQGAAALPHHQKPSARCPRHTYVRHAQWHRSSCGWGAYCAAPQAKQIPSPPPHGFMAQTGRMQRPNLAPRLKASAHLHAEATPRQTKPRPQYHYDASNRPARAGWAMPAQRHLICGHGDKRHLCCLPAWAASPPQSITARTGSLWQHYAILPLKVHRPHNAPPPA